MCSRHSKRCLWCQQPLSTTTAKSSQTNKTFKIYHQVNCKSSFVIYLLECYIYNIQHIGKSETPLNSHRKNVKNPIAVVPCKHFIKHDHYFKNHGKFIIIEQLRNIRKTSIKTLKERINNEKTSGSWNLRLKRHLVWTKT